jgi:nicotinamide riboside kinase
MLKVGISGAQDTGKTTVSRMLSGRLSSKGILTHYVSEYARDYLPKAGMVTSLAEQLFMTSQQVKREDETPKAMQVMVTDSPVFLGMVYSLLMSDTRKLDKKSIIMLDRIYDKVLDHGGYDIVILLPILWEPQDDGVRPAELRALNESIGARIDAYLTLHGMQVHRFDGQHIQDRASVMNYHTDMAEKIIIDALRPVGAAE